MNDVVEARYYRMGKKESYRYVRIKRKQKKVGKVRSEKRRGRRRGQKVVAPFYGPRRSSRT